MAGIDSVNDDRNEEKQKVGSGRSVVDVGVQCNGMYPSSSTEY